MTFAREVLGLELWPGQVAALQGWEASGRRRAILRLGRRSGKDIMAAVAALKNATVDAEDYRGLLRPGERRYVLVVATKDQQAREFVRVCRELLEAAPDPDLRALVDEGASTGAELVFRTGAVVRAMPCSSRSTRGLPASLVVFTEAAHMMTEGEGFQAFRAVWRALLPSGLQFGDRGYALVISTPLWPSGWFHQLCQMAEVGSDPDLYHVHRASWQMNPLVSRESLDGEFVADPEGASSEYGAEFAQGSDAYLDAVAVYACRRAEGVLRPGEGRYAMAIDPAFERDRFAAAVAHRDGDLLVVDGVWTWSRPGWHEVLDEVATIAGSYGVRSVRTDQEHGKALKADLDERGLAVDRVPWTSANKGPAYLQLKKLVNTRAIELPRDDELSSELVHLRASALPSGKTRIAGAAGHHDDRCSVLAAVVDTLAPAQRPLPTWQPAELSNSRRRGGRGPWPGASELEGQGWTGRNW